MVWALAVPTGINLLTMNDRVHWSSRASATLGLRAWGAWAARREHIPTCERVWVSLVVYPNNGRRFDPPNYAPTAKALVDGALVDAGVLKDDDGTHLPVMCFASGPLWRGTHKHVVLYITEREPTDLRWWRHAEEKIHPAAEVGESSIQINELIHGRRADAAR